VIAHERNITKEKLEAKQREYQLLFDVPTFSMHDSKKRHHRFWKKDRKRHEKDRQLQDREMLLEEKIAKKRKKIEKLEEELQQKDSDLQSAQQEARTLEKKLLEAREELEMKCEEVKKLQKENEELTCSYNIEKERVSKLVQVRVALTADKKKIEVRQHASPFVFSSVLISRIMLILLLYSNNWPVQKMSYGVNHSKLKPAIQVSPPSVKWWKLYHVPSRRRRLLQHNCKVSFSHHTNRYSAKQNSCWSYSNCNLRLLN